MLAQDTDQHEPICTALILEEISSESLSIALEISQERQALETLFTTISDLETLHASITASGLTPSLLTFANANNQLSNAITEIPALESLADSYTDADRDAALEGIGSKIKELVIAAISRIKSFVAKVISNIKLRLQSLAELRKQLDRYKSEVEGKQFNTEAFESLREKLINQAQLIELLEIAASVNSLGLALFAIKLPETREEKEIWKQEYDKVVTSHLGHFSLVHNGDVFVPKATAASFQSMGYSEQSFHTIAGKLEAYINDALHNDNRLMSESTRYEDEVNQRLDELVTRTSTTSTGTSHTPNGGNGYQPTINNNTQTTVVKPEAAKILEHAFYVTLDLVFELGQTAWHQGARNGLRALASVSKAYK